MRYFIVTWQSERASGSATVTTSRNKYINRDLFIEELKDTHDNISNISITNIIELSKKDFNNWNK